MGAFMGYYCAKTNYYSLDWLSSIELNTNNMFCFKDKDIEFSNKPLSVKIEGLKVDLMVGLLIILEGKQSMLRGLIR